MSILESMSSAFTPDLLSGLGSALGTDAAAVQKGLGAAGPLLLSGMAKMTETSGGAESLLKMLPQDSGFLGSLGTLFGGGTSVMEGGANLLSSMFGQGSGAVTGTLSRALGFNVGPLLGMAAPALLGTVAKLVKDKGLDAAGLATTLKGQVADYQADAANAPTLALMSSAVDAGKQATATIVSYGADWEKVVVGPAAAMFAVATADLSGPVGSIKESKAATDALALAARRAAPHSLLAIAFGGGLTTEMLGTLRALAPGKDKLLDLIKASVAAVATRAPAEVPAYKETLYAVAQATAEATKDGGFLGIGGKLVSEDEQHALDAIRAALV